MKRFFILGLILCLLASTMSFAQSPISSANDVNTPAYVEGELVVSLKGTDASAMSAQSVGMENISDFYIKKSLWNNGVSSMRSVSAEAKQAAGDVYLMGYNERKFTSFKTAKAALENKLEAMGYDVKYIEPNYLYKASAIETAATIPSNQQWHYNMIKVPGAWETTVGSRNVMVAVLDTGVDPNHINLKNNVNASLGRNFTSGSTTDTMDRQSHGTHVAGTIAAYGSVSGVMQLATIVPVKVLGDDGYGSNYGIQEGIYYAANLGADVINMSLGGGAYSQAFNDACEYAVSKGTVIVAATGNDGRGTVSYPAKYSSVIAVGSVTSSRTRSYFSNYGTGLEVMAPGSNIYSTLPGNTYASYSGTSMATPHVAGVVGLMRAANPYISVQEVRSILTSTAQYAGSSRYYGYGIVDAEAAVNAAIR